jgi:23S rRNA G2445 N2-methylase RlmL
MSAHKERMDLFATCARGLEPFLLAEARELKLARAEGRPGGVHFTGDWSDLWRANLWLRTASRVLVELRRFEAKDGDELYMGAREVDWSRFLLPEGTLRVDAKCRHSQLGNSNFAALRVKDAIVDEFRDRFGVRPSVNRSSPDLHVALMILRDRCVLAVDSSGEPLHRRGWRRHQGVAPLKETVAAACLLASGWDRSSPLLDPFCGSGTILVEGALLAGGFAPGRFRKGFGFERWPNHDEKRWRGAMDAARKAGKLRPKQILRGWDSDPKVVEAALENVEAAGFAGRIEIEARDAGEFRARKGWNAWVVTNPPYGERVGKAIALRPVFERFGTILKLGCGGFTAAILSGNPYLGKALGIVPDRMVPMKNGPLDCQLMVAELPRTPAKVR